MAGEVERPTIEQLVERHLDVLYRMAYRWTGSSMDAQDLVQETFLVAMQKLPQLREPKLALAWLMKILRSCQSRERSRHSMHARVLVDQIAEEPPTSGILEEIDQERLQAVLQEMPEEYREPLVLFYFEEFRYREIAEILDCPIGTVMSRLARAKAYLRSRLCPEPAVDFKQD